MEPSKVSFTIRRPTPVSRAASSGPESDAGSSFKIPKLPPHIHGEPTPIGSPLARNQDSPAPREAHTYDSSDEESTNEDELVTGFDKFGVQRLNGEKKVEKPLIIPALKNKDWRELARKRRAATQYVPPSAAAQTGKDGSVGGLGTRDTINSGPVLSGLQVKQKANLVEDEVASSETEEVKMEIVEEETDDQKALRAILAETSGDSHYDGPMVDIIPTPISEADALKQDVEELPDAATLEDYARVPVSQFGAALLRGMGWKEGTAATRKPGKGLIEPYLPASRPALLGIGAKEQEVYDDGSKKNSKAKRPERRYVPVIKQERADSALSKGGSRQRDRSRSPRRSATSSRRNSPDRYSSRTETDERRRYDDDRRRDTSRRGEEDERRYDKSRGEDRKRDSDKDRRRDERRRDDDGGRRRGDDRDRSEKRREETYDSSKRRRDC
ncbi:Pre-mRNA-splicing factor SPP2 [Psilocybe cubensis]|uniref:Pre-mRNA-splicing factor SPP2 n=2 Tax=Psilocybe cubensis TaxID=181762 RepID=A0ACB8HC44_PSICU|nr:Pre-mRNA-splicing factor SPP2 [Psilocybe cubensis]KAH9485217.1 Pre-mRNA-splicing factor SPP2 [Psilocybe cubensis]